MKKRHISIIFIVFVALCVFLFGFFYQEAKRESIEMLNLEQRLHARQAARSIEDFFSNWTKILAMLSRTNHIINMNRTGIENMESLYNENSELIRAVTRVDAGGRIIYTIPYDPNAIGKDISSQKHIREIARTRKPVISDVFSAVQGYSTVALHVPVFNGQNYHGTIGIGINFQSLSKRYMEGIKIGETGYAWMVSRDGTELFCPVPGHVGKSVFENCKDFPSILVMAEDMLKGHEGATVYEFDKIREDTVDVVRKHAVYLPIHIGNTFWSIVVASSEDEIIASLKDFRNRLILIIGFFLMGGACFSFYGLKAWFIIQEEEKRKKAEQALRESEATIRTLINNAPADSILLLDARGVILDINQTGAERLGKKREELIGTHTHKSLPDDVASSRLTIMKKMFETRNPVRYEDKHGDIWFDTVASPILNEDGTISKIAVIARDITKLKRAEEMYARIADEWNATFDSINSVVWILDKEHRIILSNKAAETYFNRPIYDLIGEKCWAIVHGTDRPIPECPVLRVKKSLKRESMDFQVGNKWLEVVVDPIVDETGKFAGAVHIVSDITERKQADEALQASRKQLMDIIDFLPDATLVIDKERGIIVWNKAIEKMTGIPALEMLGKGGYTYTIPFYGEARKSLMDLVFEESKETEAKYPLITREGNIIMAEVFCNALYENRGAWVFAIASPLYDRSGNIIGAIESIRDITERKLAEKALNDERNFISNIMQISPIGITTVDSSGMITFANSRAAGILGFSKEEIAQMSYNSAKFAISDFDGNPIPDEKFPFKIVMSTGRPVFDIRHAIQWPDGKRILLSINGVPMTDANGNVTGMVATIEDITERIKAEEALVFEKQRFLFLLENSPFGIAVISKNGSISYINRKFREIFGYEPEDIPDGRAWFRRAYPDADYRHEVISAWTGDLEKSGVGEQRPRIYSVKCRDGSVKIINFLPVMLATGDNIMACEDITLRVNAEEEKRKLEERFARAEKMEALGTLAGGVAHDLNNVLGIVVGYAELLLDEVEKTSAIREHVESIYNSGRKAAAMIDDMLTMARRGVQSRQVINLNNIIMEGKKSPEFMGLYQQYSSVEIKEYIDPDLLNISGSPVHLYKTLFNLILNAFEAMPKGGILTISTYNQYLENPVKGYDEVRSGDYVVLSVSDTGIGIKPADLKRIFEPFYTKKKMGRSGTGLGLAVVWSTVKDHNGYIDVQSEEEKGSVFTLYYPVSREEITAESAAVSAADYMGNGEAILVVDDVKGQRNLAAEMLRKLNYNVTSASSGEEAVEYLKDKEADLIILDMIMEPGMDGLDTYKCVLEIRPKQKAIIVSGFSETDRVEEARSLGAGAYVKKPYVMEKLGLAVKKELERRHGTWKNE